MSKKGALRLEYLDGLRALAATYVVLFHAGLGFTTAALPSWAKNVARTLSFGHDAVAVFIVLSGYCLMLPVARAEGQITRGIPSYFARRAWRILPPYFATLFGSLLLLALVPALQAQTGTIWDDTSPAFELGPIVSHLFLVHNLFPAWAQRIDGPLWSVATEWQIYFFFPFLLVPIWRRFGALVTLLLAFGTGCALVWIVPSAARTACAWYLGLFALGMCAAGINFASRPFERTLRERGPWGLVTLGLLAAVGVGVTVLIKRWFLFMPYSDSLVGIATASALLHLTRQALKPASAPRPLVLRVLESAPLVGLGRFSYSLYLTHLPVVALGFFGLRRLALAPGTAWLALLAWSLPVSLLTAYAFYLVFERRFVGGPPISFGKSRA